MISYAKLHTQHSHTNAHFVFTHLSREMETTLSEPTKTHLNGFVNMESKWSRKWHKNIPGSFVVYLKDTLQRESNPKP
jgi:hypothetical protein